MEYAFTHNGIGYTPSGKITLSADRVPSHNEECETADMATIAAGAPVVVYPKHEKRENDPRNMAPLTGSGVTLWTGRRVGTIIKCRVYRNPFGGTLTAYTWRDLSGRYWYGRGAGDGMMLRSRLRKH